MFVCRFSDIFSVCKVNSYDMRNEKRNKIIQKRNSKKRKQTKKKTIPTSTNKCIQTKKNPQETEKQNQQYIITNMYNKICGIIAPLLNRYSHEVPAILKYSVLLAWKIATFNSKDFCSFFL